ncbi:Nicalin [Galemys pyrenaicus]|uniref:Nicalin n=1 Tax=Galemys pyrenaicus TaxID=202257 RepID=A0A8J6ADP5_GALPY|nr:Nicalin [Galemys pyrenaicus]
MRVLPPRWGWGPAQAEWQGEPPSKHFLPRDPEFVFYDQLKQVMNAYRVKPAIFDLLLAVCIGAYLGMAYTAVQNSPETAPESEDAVTATGRCPRSAVRVPE